MTKTLTLLPVLLAVNIPPWFSPIDRRLMGGKGALELNTTCQSSLAGKAVPDLATRWGPLHRTSGLATGFI